MAVIQRCDSCRTEGAVSEYSLPTGDWCKIYRCGQESLLFCSEGCLADYYIAQRMIEGAV